MSVKINPIKNTFLKIDHSLNLLNFSLFKKNNDNKKRLYESNKFRFFTVLYDSGWKQTEVLDEGVGG
mgnify:CR=1 FL=1